MFTKFQIIWLELLFSSFLTACSVKPVLTITVENPLNNKRLEELVEIKINKFESLLQPCKEKFILIDEQGHEIPYQITHDENLIFPVIMDANAMRIFYLKRGTPSGIKVLTSGQQYPERVDDIAWENDKIAFRTYGPALQRSHERAFGFDIWLKNTPEFVVADRYAKELNPESKSMIKELKKNGEIKKAKELARAISYHIDHGNGMDCYKVGPTLGAGAPALLQKDSTIIYPYCYKDFKILDNGPLRFKVELIYNTFELNGEDVVETRVIQLDQGSHLNKTKVSYEGVTCYSPLAVGIVIQPFHKDKYSFNKNDGYISYIDPTDNPQNGNGVIYVGAVIPKGLNETKVCLFTDEERKNHGNALGHVMGFTTYQPNSTFTYYWGAGWSKFDIKSEKEWITYLKNYADQLRHPLIIKVNCNKK